MGLDVVIGPADAFREWTPEQWDEYAEQNAGTEGDKLGGYTAVACTVETISGLLEGGRLGSRFPELMRIAQPEGGWYLSELPPLLAEIRTVRDELSQRPLEQLILVTFEADNLEPQIRPVRSDELPDLRADFERAHPDHPLENLADFSHHLLDMLEALARRALEVKGGLVLC